MREISKRFIDRAVPAVVACIAMILITAMPIRAATIDEIVSMQEAGISPEIIIEVIDATGLDDPMDEDAWSVLLENDIDPLILEYLVAEYLATSEDSDDWLSDDESGGDNRMGGEGFHHEPTGYSPLYQHEYYNNYYDGSRYGDCYGGRYDYNRGIIVYEPPVYIWHDYPSWSSGWHGPGFYRHDRVYRDYGGCGWGSPYHHYHHRYYDDGWGWGGRFRYDDRRDRWDNDFGVWFRDDDFSFRIRF